MLEGNDDAFCYLSAPTRCGADSLAGGVFGKREEGEGKDGRDGLLRLGSLEVCRDIEISPQSWQFMSESN